MESPPTARSVLVRAGRILLGLAVGASFGVYVGALIASWVYGVEAIESEAVNASYLAAGVTLFGAAAGALIAYRTGRRAAAGEDSAGSFIVADREELPH